MTTGPFVVSFVGPSGVGKTTLIEQLIPCLRAAGLRVGTVKHAPHGHDVVDKPGSDSLRHRTAGAEAVLLAGGGGAVVFLTPDHPDEHPGRHHSPVSDDQQLARLSELIAIHLAHVDVVVAEGFAPIHDALIAVQRADVPPKPSHDSTPVWFTVSDRPTGDDPTGNDLRFDQLDELARRIVARTDSRSAVFGVTPRPQPRGEDEAAS